MHSDWNQNKNDLLTWPKTSIHYSTLPTRKITFQAWKELCLSRFTTMKINQIRARENLVKEAMCSVVKQKSVIWNGNLDVHADRLLHLQSLCFGFTPRCSSSRVTAFSLFINPKSSGFRNHWLTLIRRDVTDDFWDAEWCCSRVLDRFQVILSTVYNSGALRNVDAGSTAHQGTVSLKTKLIWTPKYIIKCLG